MHLKDFSKNFLICNKRKSSLKLLFLLVTVSSRSFFTFVSSYLMSFSFFTTWHNLVVFKLVIIYFTSVFVLTPSTNTLAGLKAGML